MTEMRPPYAPTDKAGFGHISESIAQLPWLGPRHVAEAYPWDVLPLGGTPSRQLPEHVIEAVVAASRHPEYPGTLGSLALRTAIAERLSDELAAPIDPMRNVLITVGSMQGLHLAAAVSTRGTGRAIAHAPSFFYADLVAAAGGRCDWSGGADGPPDWRAFGSAITSDVRAAIVNTPVNPTGYVFTEEDIEAVAAAVHGSDTWVFSDEAYAAYCYDGRKHISPATHPELRARTLILRSFSKAYAFGAWRVGFAVGPEPLIAAMAKLLQYSVIGVPTVVQAAALAAYTGPQEWARQMVDELGAVRDPVVDAINSTEFLRTDRPQAGTTVWVRLPPTDSETAVSELLGRAHGVPAVPGALFGAAEPHLRIPFAGGVGAHDVLVQRISDLSAASTNEDGYVGEVPAGSM
jgi:aspartate/methionine/tyrosine aminotransferase